MAKLTIDDLKRIKKEHEGELNSPEVKHLLICGGTGCHATGSIAVMRVLKEEITAQGLSERIKVVETGCNGFCAMGPILVVHPDGIFYQKLTVDDIPGMVKEHFIDGKPIEKLMYKDPATKKRIPLQNEIPFFAHQMPRALRNKGLIDPEQIVDYIARDGYQGAHKALNKMAPEEIVQQMIISGLRGRGGAGFPTGMKWDFASKSPGTVKYVLCNADEGDPGAFMDRSILEADPHAVLEGMLIAARAINASKGYIYARTEYPLAIKRLEIAIAQAKAYGLLGDDIFGTGMNFDIEIYQGAGAFVCGEETALIASIEGKRGTPCPRPPYPSVKGLWGSSTVINNVETLANIAPIILNGGAWFAKFGTDNSKGTKVFAVTGKVKNSGLIEVPMGTTLRDIVYEIGGGPAAGAKFKAVQTGGPSGGVIPEQLLDTGVDYDNLQKLGSIMGSGGLIVMDEHDCMVDIAKFYLKFCVDESCGKCAPCRIGGWQLLHILEGISEGRGTLEDLDRMRRISKAMQKASLCGLGQTAANPVLSTLKYFEDEYREHIVNHRCPAKKCTALLDFFIVKNKCKKCGLCARTCPEKAISGDREHGYAIDKTRCINCGLCFEACKFEAVERN
ncbi:NADH-ubiquinone oxidoreductase-F iron-sulfur binding region domain-containing protein [Desulfococcus sp.]|uniref:NADH-ubiquinone oxidoreductase-F iron-sulfur binding region domain-containing protein n=1 Tax=Desulfococcus sp. TaxID=2025834 RepID=UPI003593A358